MNSNGVPEVIPEVDELVTKLADRLANVRETVMLEALNNLIFEINERRHNLRRENGIHVKITKKVLTSK